MFGFFSQAKQNIFRLSLVMLALVFTGLGCKGLSAEERASVRPVTLEYWTVFNNVEALNELARRYKQIRPHVSINIRRLRLEEFDDKFVNALADDVPPDIISFQNFALSKYQSRLSPMPASVRMSRLVTRGNSFSRETVVEAVTESLPTLRQIETAFIPAVKDDLVKGGAIYGLPLAVDALGIYYNKKLLDLAGVPLPPATWTEFFEAVKKSTRLTQDGRIVQSGVSLGTGSNISNSFEIWSLLMMQSGAPLMSGSQAIFADGLNERTAENHPSVGALRFYADFGRADKQVYSWNSDQEDAFNTFVRGRSVFYFGFAFDRARILSLAPGIELEAISVPQLNPTTPVNLAYYWAEGVVKKSRKQNEAWDFLRFVFLPDNLAFYTAASGQPSPLRSELSRQLSDAQISPFAASMLSARHWYRGIDPDIARSAIVSMLDSVHTELKNQALDTTETVLYANSLIRAARSLQ